VITHDYHDQELKDSVAELKSYAKERRGLKESDHKGVESLLHMAKSHKKGVAMNAADDLVD
jgi:hypothetical protein